MKYSKFSKLFVLLGLFSITLFISCSDDDDNNNTIDPPPQLKDIVETAQNTADLSTLVSALESAKLVTALQGDGPFTVFAPTNAAFQALLDSNSDWNGLSDIPADLLESVLLFHVVSGKVKAADLSDTYVPTLSTTAQGDKASLQVQVTGGVAFNGDAKPITTDIETSNGIVHIIDKVMLPPSIVDLAVNNSNLSSLVSALQKAELVETLQGNGPFTVFAPTNAAFQALLDSNEDWNSLDDVPVNDLKNILLFHVVSGNTKSTDLSDTYVSTVATGPNSENLSLQIMVTGGVKFNGDAAPVLTDIIGKNGVVHVIDKVMLPPTVVNLALNNDAFSLLVAALTDDRHTTDFVSVLNGDGPFTVFAPTNAAFQALLDSNEDWSAISDIPIGTLDAVLKYHVVSGSNVQSNELTDNQEITMLSGGSVTVDLSSSAKLETSSDQTVNITSTDVQGKNGVIHVIDTVLLEGED